MEMEAEAGAMGNIEIGAKSYDNLKGKLEPTLGDKTVGQLSQNKANK